MRLRAWLRTTFLAAIATLTFTAGARAQDTSLALAAYQVYLQANAAGDQGAMDAALAELGAACAALGYSDLNTCVSTLNVPPTAEQLEAQFQQEVAGPLADYQAAYDLAASGGDLQQAQAMADDAAYRNRRVTVRRITVASAE